ncbi:MbnH family di-heme enzyme [Psychrobium sp. nBUS_13]|uniref:MbnH family di-heme enzyme n=1 Tax=Psychrobium sp. nBUS_13 TaxID=3395319 RepID=UPI003EB79255
MIKKFLTIIFAIVLIFGCDKAPTDNENKYNWDFPQGFPKPFVPADNPMSTEKVELGRFLFYDTQLSANGSQSCASCHLQSRAFSEPLTTSVGSTGQIHRRNAQALVNVAFNHSLTWANDEIVTLERQILLPLFGEQPIEMGVGSHEDEILERLSNTRYKALFLNAFGDDEINFDRIVKALASFTRSLVSLDSPFDQYAYQMIDDALSESQLRGMNMFFSEKLECHHCHGGFNFTQSTTHEKQQLDLRAFHNTGLYNLAGEYSYPKLDTGLFEATAKPQDVGRFRTPTLRNVELTAPYMHDGSIATLSEVVDFYAAGGRHIKTGEFVGDGRENPFKSQFVKGFELDAQQKTDLVAFLEALTDSEFINNPKHANPFLEKH